MHPQNDPDNLDEFFSDEEEAGLIAFLNQAKPKEAVPAPARPSAPTGPPAGRQAVPQGPPKAAPTPQLPPPRPEGGAVKGASPESGTRRYLKVIAGTNQGSRLPLPAQATFRVGRAPDVEVQLDDLRVSRYHCRLNVEAGRVTVLDLGSKTGTLVNNQRIIGQRLLLTGDVLGIGDTHLQLTSDLLNDTTDSVPAFKEGARPSPAPSRAVPAIPVPVDQARPNSPAHDLVKLTNTSLGYLKLGPFLGVGKSGVVFRALDTRDQSPVAVKVFVPELSNSEEDVQRFVRAAKTVMPLRNLHLVDFYNAGRIKGHCWVSMELIEGPSLAWHVQQAAASQPPWRLAMRVLQEVTRALIFLHGKQIIHRNLTPENLLVSSADGLIKVSDLITAKAQEGKLAQDVTAQGHLVGDLRYLAPERTSGEPSDGDARSDLYSLGAVVYAVLTGRPPLEGKTVFDTIEKIRQRVPTPLRQLLPGVPAALDAVVTRLLAKEPEQRFDNATELLRHLVMHKLMD